MVLFVSAPTLIPPIPAPAIWKLSKLKVPPVPTVTNTRPAPVIIPVKLLFAAEPIKPPELVTVKFFQFEAMELKVVEYVANVGLSTAVGTGKELTATYQLVPLSCTARNAVTLLAEVLGAMSTEKFKFG